VACSVTITDFLEVTPGTLRVVGMAVDCTAVRLQTSCGVPDPQQLPIPVTIAPPQCSCAQGGTPAGCTFTATATPVGNAPPYTGSYRWKVFRSVGGAPQSPPLQNQGWSCS
jgi:hypothetical protein